jgi:hypothetical protein
VAEAALAGAHPPLLQEAPRIAGLLYCTRGAVVPLGSLTRGCLPLTLGDHYGVELDGDVRYAQDPHEQLAVYDGKASDVAGGHDLDCREQRVVDADGDRLAVPDLCRPGLVRVLIEGEAPRDDVVLGDYAPQLPFLAAEGKGVDVELGELEVAEDNIAEDVPSGSLES